MNNMYGCICTYMYINTNLNIATSMYIYIHAYEYTNIHVYIQMYIPHVLSCKQLSTRLLSLQVGALNVYKSLKVDVAL
jgi:hypothetical protein